MFDPTAFDNMKVVIEGDLYDKDIHGEIVICDRNDWVNLAKMSRIFDISFHLPNSSITAKIEIGARLNNLAAELLSGSNLDQEAGSSVRLQFSLEHEETIDYQALKNTLTAIWGETRKIQLSAEFDPLATNRRSSTVLTVDFERLIVEDQMDDLVQMTTYMVETLENLNRWE